MEAAARPDALATDQGYRLFLFPAGRDKGQIIGASPRKRVGRPAARNCGGRSAIDAAGGQPFPVNSLDQYPGYLL